MIIKKVFHLNSDLILSIALNEAKEICNEDEKFCEDIGINGFREKSAHGIFVKKDDGYKYKISSIGCRFKNWISYHGFSINNNPDLENYNGINPCGSSNKFVTSIFDLGKDIAVNELDIAIKRNILKNI